MINIQLPNNYIMDSRDIVLLYPSIDMEEVSNKIYNGIEQTEYFEDDVKLTIKRCLNQIIHNNFFLFNGKYYK